ncbi:hypothetical protein [Duganella sp. CF517]|uniref:hypothetical protein n=1 Tax=Duganella sp. CF517 TaxID=1881038 RepID=UPI0011608537|nr:hypothetical protein [Duganella sp. CF517]
MSANPSNDRLFFLFNSARKSSCKSAALLVFICADLRVPLEIEMHCAAKIASIIFSPRNRRGTDEKDAHEPV